MKKDIRIEEVLYYLIEKTTKTARRYSQQRFAEAGLDITVDQWLVLKKISDTDGISQADLAGALFKDTASITRILDLMIAKKLVSKVTAADKRAYQLSLTASGRRLHDKALPLVIEMRAKGIARMTDTEVQTLRQGLQKIIDNLS